MLIIFAGLPGAGKTTLSKALSEKLGAVYLRIDTIEQACKDSKIFHIETAEDAGYLVGYGVARDNLGHGLTVVADSVNPIEVTRNDWRKVAEEANVKSVDIEIICSDKVEHKKRIESRTADLESHQLLTWQDVVGRDYESHDQCSIVIDTAGAKIETCIEEILSTIARV